MSSYETRPSSEKKKKLVKMRRKGKSNSVDLENERNVEQDQIKLNGQLIKSKLKKNATDDEVNSPKDLVDSGSPNKQKSNPDSPRRTVSALGTTRRTKKSKEKPPVGSSFFYKYVPFVEEDYLLLNIMKDPNATFDDSLRNRIYDALKRYEETKKDISVLEEHNQTILEEINDMKDSIHIMEKRIIDAQSFYASLQDEHGNVKDLLRNVENEGIGMVQNVARLDKKIRSLQRTVNQNFVIQLIIFLLTLIVHILSSPVYLVAFIYDAVINNHVNKNVIKEEGMDEVKINVKQSRTLQQVQKYLKTQRKKLSLFLEYFEDLIMNRKSD